MRSSARLFLGCLLLLACARGLSAQPPCDFSYSLPDTIFFCTGDSAIVDIGSLPDTLDVVWSTGSMQSAITFTELGTYLLTISNENNTCETVDTVELVADPLPRIGFITSDRVCANERLRLVDLSNVPGPGGTVTYTFPDQNYSIGPGDTLFYPAPSVADTSSVFVLATTAQNCQARDTFSLITLARPRIDYILQPEAICFFDTLTIIDRSIVASEGSIRYALSSIPLSTTPGDTIPFYPPAFGLDTAVINVRAEQNGCVSVDTFSIIPLPTPDASINVAPETCQNEAVRFDLAVANGDDGFSFLFSPGGSLAERSGSSTSSDRAVSQSYPAPGRYGYSFLFSFVNGCTATVADSLTILDFSEPNLIGIEPAYCSDGTLDTLILSPRGGVVMGNGIVPGSLTDSSVVISAQQTGNFSISYAYTAANGCTGTAAYEYTVNPLPQVDLGPEDTLLVSGQLLTLGPLVPSAEYSYSWSTGATTPTLEVTNPGFYVLEASIGGTGCRVSDTIEVRLANPVFAYPRLEALRVFPNPARAFVQVDIPTGTRSAAAELHIWNSAGQRVSLHRVADLPTPPGPVAALRIDLPPDWPAGLYLLTWGSYRGSFLVLR